MEGGIQTAFELIRPFLVAGILTVFCYRVMSAVLLGDASQAFRLLTWGLAFGVGFVLVDIAAGTKIGAQAQLISCKSFSHVSECNGWVFFGKNSKVFVGFIEMLSNSGIFNTASISVIMSVAGFVLVLELTKAVWKASAPPIIAAFFTGCVIYVVLVNPGFFLSTISSFLTSGGTDGGNLLASVNNKIEGLDRLLTTADAVNSTAGVMQNVSNVIGTPLRYLIDSLLLISFALASLMNAIFLILGTLVLGFLPNLVLFYTVMGSFDKWSLVRWIAYLAALKLIVVLELWAMNLLPTIDTNSQKGLMDMVSALNDVGSSVFMSLLVIIAVIGGVIFGALKLLAVIWARELRPAYKMGGVLMENFSSRPMEKYFN